MAIETFFDLDYKAPFGRKITKSDRKYFRWYVMSKTYSRLLELVSLYQMTPTPTRESKRHLIEIYIEKCKWPFVMELIKKFE